MTEIPIDCTTCGRYPCAFYYRRVCYLIAEEKGIEPQYRNWFPNDKHLIPWVLQKRGFVQNEEGDWIKDE